MKAKRPNVFKRFHAWLHAVPHLFAKLIILYCILYASAACAFCVWRQGQGLEMAGILAVALGFFGGELLLLCLKTIFEKEDRDDENTPDKPCV